MDSGKDNSVCKACGSTSFDVKCRLNSTQSLCFNCIGIYMDHLDIMHSQESKEDIRSSHQHDHMHCPLTTLKNKCTDCVLAYFNLECGCDPALRLKTCSFCRTEANQHSHPNDLPQCRKGSRLPVCLNCIKLYQRRLAEIDPEDTPCELALEECLKEGSKCPTHVVEFFESKIGVIRETDPKHNNDPIHEADQIPKGAVYSFKRTEGNVGSSVTIVVGEMLGSAGAHGAAYDCKRDGKAAAVKFFFRGDDWYKEVEMVKKMKQAGITNAFVDIYNDLPLGYTMVLYGKSMNEFIAKKPDGYSFPYLSSASFCYQLSNIMDKLVINNLVHSDIGETNVCLAKDGVKVWMIDFTDSTIILMIISALDKISFSNSAKLDFESFDIINYQ